MARYEHTIHIDAPPEVIWNVWTDIASWPRWTATIPIAKPLDDAPLGVGKKARLMVKGAGSSIFTVTDCEPGRRFIWETTVRGVHAAAGHLVGVEGAGSNVTLSVNYSGVMATLFAPLLSRVAKANLPEEAEGLKKHCEAATNAARERSKDTTSSS